MLFYGKAKENSRHLKFLIHVRFCDLQQKSNGLNFRKCLSVFFIRRRKPVTKDQFGINPKVIIFFSLFKC